MQSLHEVRRAVTLSKVGSQVANVYAASGRQNRRAINKVFVDNPRHIPVDQVHELPAVHQT